MEAATDKHLEVLEKMSAVDPTRGTRYSAQYSRWMEALRLSGHTFGRRVLEDLAHCHPTAEN